MYFNNFKGLKLSALGFGTMRFPLKADGTPDLELTKNMIGEAYRAGVNYYDTAFPYMNGKSEEITAECLSEYPRTSYFLADKMPGHQFYDKLDPKAVFEEQLRRLRTDYIDFYLLHNVNDSCMETYMDKGPGIIPYLLKEKENGRIRFLGFSAHATLPELEEFLKYLKSHDYPMDFCQIQLNYLDWTLQKGKEKVQLLKEYGIPVWVMEPLRGGKLSKLPLKERNRLPGNGAESSDASFAFRWLMQFPEVIMILSGMSSSEALRDNLRTFSVRRPLSGEENSLILEIAENLKNGVPCTGCRYCTENCPRGLDIPFLMDLYNDYSVEIHMTPAVLLSSVEKGKRPSDCIGCGNCELSCPQHIRIPAVMKELSSLIDRGIDWEKVCMERNRMFES